MRAPILTAVLLLASATGAGAASWSSPAVIPGVQSPNAVTFTYDGTGAVLSLAGTQSSATEDTVGSFSPLGRPFGAPVPVVPTGYLFVDAAGFGPDGLALAGGQDTSQHIRAFYATGAPGAVLTPRPLGPTDGVSLATSVAGNAVGDLAVEYTVCTSPDCRHSDVWLMVHRARRGSRTYLLGRTRHRLHRTAVAMSPGGEVLAAWSSDAVHARRVSPRGVLGRSQAVSPHLPILLELRALETGFQRGVVAWAAESFGECMIGSPAVFGAAFAPRDGTFRAAQQLATFDYRHCGAEVTDGAIGLAQAGNGPVTAAWTDYRDGHFVVRYSDLAGSRFRAPATISPPGSDAVFSALAGSPWGDTVALFRTGVRGSDPAPGRTPTVMATVRGPGAAGFGAPEQLSDGVTFAQAPHLAIDWRTGRAAAAWTYPTNPLTVEVATREP